MARRKRLTPAQALSDAALPERLEIKSSLPPIASVAGQSATEAALQEVAQEMRSAREEGRLIQLIPLDAIAEDHLVRDRMVAEDEDMAALVASILARGQTTPIEVVTLSPGRYGLISGWRRLQALRRLRGSASADDGRFARVRALVLHPRDAGEAYVAMVEENEIRADLSHYERARIVARSVAAGAFPDAQTALRSLFANASRAKRSKIKSFMTLVEQLDDALRYPTYLGERLGLELAGRLTEDAGFAALLSLTLSQAAPGSPEAEADILREALTPSVSCAKQAMSTKDKTADKADKSQSQEIVPGIRLSASTGRLILSGPGVNDVLLQALSNWLSTRSS